MRAPRFVHAPMRYGSNEEETARADAMKEDYAKKNPEKAGILKRWSCGEITGAEAARLMEEVDRRVAGEQIK